MSVSNHFGSFRGNRNVNLKLVNQNGRQFRPHYVIRPIDAVWSRVCTHRPRGKTFDFSGGGAAPPQSL